MPVKKYRIDTDKGSFEVEVDEGGGPQAIDPNEPDTYMGGVAKSLLDTAKRTGAGVLEGLNPIEAAKGLASTVMHPIDSAQAAYHAVTHPGETISALSDPETGGKAIGGLLLGGAMGRALPSVPKGLSATGRVLEDAAGTAPASTRLPIAGAEFVGGMATGHPIMGTAGAAATLAGPPAVRFIGRSMQRAGEALGSRADAAAIEDFHGGPKPPVTPPAPIRINSTPDVWARQPLTPEGTTLEQFSPASRTPSPGITINTGSDPFSRAELPKPKPSIAVRMGQKPPSLQEVLTDALKPTGEAEKAVTLPPAPGADITAAPGAYLGRTKSGKLGKYGGYTTGNPSTPEIQIAPETQARLDAPAPEPKVATPEMQGYKLKDLLPKSLSKRGRPSSTPGYTIDDIESLGLDPKVDYSDVVMTNDAAQARQIMERGLTARTVRAGSHRSLAQIDAAIKAQMENDK